MVGYPCLTCIKACAGLGVGDKQPSGQGGCLPLRQRLGTRRVSFSAGLPILDSLAAARLYCSDGPGALRGALAHGADALLWRGLWKAADAVAASGIVWELPVL